jgi:hypothetical protein
MGLDVIEVLKESSGRLEERIREEGAENVTTFYLAKQDKAGEGGIKTWLMVWITPLRAKWLGAVTFDAPLRDTIGWSKVTVMDCPWEVGKAPATSWKEGRIDVVTTWYWMMALS